MGYSNGSEIGPDRNSGFGPVLVPVVCKRPRARDDRDRVSCIQRFRWNLGRYQ